MPPVNMRNKKPSMKFSKGTVKRLLHMVTKDYKKQLIFVVVCILISAIASVSSPLFMKTIIDDYITPLLGTDNPNFSNLNKIILVMICIYIIGISATYIYNRLMSIIAQGVLRNVRNEMFEKMEKLPIRFFDTNTHGDIMSYYTNDADTLREMISRSLPQFVSSLFSLVTVLFSMIYLSWQLTIFAMLFVLLIVFTSQKVTGNSAKYFIGQQKSLGKVNGYIEEMINGQKVVKVFTYEKRAEKEFDKINEELFKNQVKANSFANMLMPALSNLGNIEYVLMAVIGGYLAINNIVAGITIGTMASFLALVRSFNQPINQISNQINLIIMALAGAERIFYLMDQEPEVDNGYVTLVNAKIVDNKIEETEEFTGKWAWKYPHHDGRLEYIEVKGHIEFVDVDFGYEENNLVLHNISLYAKPGQKIAFVGATGAGKTTITNLINRFYDIEDGKIRYDGININKIKKADLRKSLGMVLQDTNLFTGTIKDNIRYVNQSATDEEIINAAKIANAHNFISNLPDGYDTMLTENGSQLSQGQRQLISIARAALANPPVMILDEATSSIDTRTEKIVQDGMDKLMEGRTVFVIAHRLSTVRNSKAIMVMDHGKIIERGNHEDLIALKGQYYMLYTGAFELE